MKTCYITLLIASLFCCAFSNTCSPAFSPGFTDTSICETTYGVKNEYWLPDSYIHNAVCACEGIPTSSYEANCIREFLVTRINSKSRYSDSFRQEMADAKQSFAQHPIANLVSYKSLVISKFVPIVYEDHQDAYKQCCCPGTPAFYDSWKAVATVDVPTCGMVVQSIDMFGSCHKTPGAW